MNHAANSADVADSEIRRLLKRLCDTTAGVVFFPVRHHSPACAGLIESLIEEMRPTAVLVEGPSDFNDRLDELFLDHRLPIAIYSYFRGEGTHGGAYYPFCDYSPEWVALHAAHQQGAVVRFIDLPWKDVAHLDRLTHRYSDAHFRRSRYVSRLCQQMQVEDFDDLWDKLVESQEQLTLADYLERVHSLCFHIRLWESSTSDADQQRETFMADQIQATREATAGQILVITGGYHSSALALKEASADFTGLDHLIVKPHDPVIEDACDRASAHSNGALQAAPQKPAIVDSGIALTTYSYERLDNLSGYDSGMPSPRFYDHTWRQRQNREVRSHHPLLVDLVQELRVRKQVLSTADLIAVETSARGLASLRGRTNVWRRDLIDAVTSALIKDEVEYGCPLPFLDAIHSVLRGKRKGVLGSGTRLPPLVLEIREQLAKHRCEATVAPRDVDVDLLKSDDLATSRLLHRLKILDIAGYSRIDGTDFLERENLNKVCETWRIRWSPELESSCIEASRYGTSLIDAAASRLTEMATGKDLNAAAAAGLLVEASLAGIETLSTTLLDQLDQFMIDETQFVIVAMALEHLLFLYCHDEAFGTNRLPQIGRLFRSAFERSLWVLESLGQSTGNEQPILRGIKALLESFQRAAELLEFDRSEFASVMSRVEGDRHKPPAIRGAAAGILWTLGVADDERILADLLMFTAPSELGDFLSGLFALAREVAQRHHQLVGTIDRMLNEFGADDFQECLPSMRLAFTYFTPREKHYMLTTLFEELGIKSVRPLARLAVDHQTAANVLAFEERLFEIVTKYDLEARDE